MLHFISRRSTLVLLGTVTLWFVLLVRADPVDDYMRAELDRQRIPGAAIAVTRGGKIVKAAGAEFLNLKNFL